MMIDTSSATCFAALAIWEPEKVFYGFDQFARRWQINALISNLGTYKYVWRQPCCLNKPRHANPHADPNEPPEKYHTEEELSRHDGCCQSMASCVHTGFKDPVLDKLFGRDQAITLYRKTEHERNQREERLRTA